MRYGKTRKKCEREYDDERTRRQIREVDRCWYEAKSSYPLAQIVLEVYESLCREPRVHAIRSKVDVEQKLREARSNETGAIIANLLLSSAHLPDEEEKRA